MRGSGRRGKEAWKAPLPGVISCPRLGGRSWARPGTCCFKTHLCLLCLERELDFAPPYVPAPNPKVETWAPGDPSRGSRGLGSGACCALRPGTVRFQAVASCASPPRVNINGHHAPPGGLEGPGAEANGPWATAVFLLQRGRRPPSPRRPPALPSPVSDGAACFTFPMANGVGATVRGLVLRNLALVPASPVTGLVFVTLPPCARGAPHGRAGVSGKKAAIDFPVAACNH